MTEADFSLAPDWLMIDYAHLVLTGVGVAAVFCLPPHCPLGYVFGKMLYEALYLCRNPFFSRGQRRSSSDDLDVSVCLLCHGELDPAPSDSNKRSHHAAYLMLCGHTFGHSCIDSYLRYEAESCPACGQRATFLHLFDAEGGDQHA